MSSITHEIALDNFHSQIRFVLDGYQPHGRKSNAYQNAIIGGLGGSGIGGRIAKLAFYDKFPISIENYSEYQLPAYANSSFLIILVENPSVRVNFLICHRVIDLEFLRMQRRLRTERELAEVLLLHLDKEPFVFVSQTFQHVGMHIDLELEVRLIPMAFLENLTELPLNLHAHGKGTLHLAATLAIRTVVIDGSMHALGVSLASHLHQTQI